MQVIMEIFWKRAKELLENITDRYAFDITYCVIPVLLCTTHDWKDVRYLPVDTLPYSKAMQNAGQNKIGFQQRKSISSPTRFSSFQSFWYSDIS